MAKTAAALHILVKEEKLALDRSFAEDLVKCLQNGLNFSGIGGRTDNLVHNQHYSEN